MPNYLTPGVYFEWVDHSRGRLTAVRTDIAAFIGLAERGPLHQAVRLNSWTQFQTQFGGFIPGGYLAYTVKAFFDNGGRTCYVIRIADQEAKAAGGELPGIDGSHTLQIEASSPGQWGNRLQVRLANGRFQATQTQASYPQPTDGLSSHVDSIVGFTPGSLVRATQDNLIQYLVVKATDAAWRQIVWQDPLILAPPDPGFDPTQPIHLETLSFTLTVYEAGTIRAIYPDLTIIPTHERYAPTIINQADAPLITVTDLHQGQPPPANWHQWWPDITADTCQFTEGLLTLVGGVDGLAHLETVHFTGDLAAATRTGLRVLELIEDVSLVAIPDILIQPTPPLTYAPQPPQPVDPCLEEVPVSPPPPVPDPCALLLAPVPAEQPPQFDESQVFLVYQTLVTHCQQQQDRVALLDPLPPRQSHIFDPSDVLAWRQQFDSSFAALYYPWVQVLDPLRLGGQLTRALPPSGHVAGIIARTDLAQGVHHPPANRVLQWAEGTTLTITDEWQGILNPAHINCIRPFPGRGLRLYGARTLSSNTTWRFLNVRRLLLMLEKTISLSIQWAVFEPNSIYLRQTLILAISNLLYTLWQRGAFRGKTAEEAYFVQCDADNNPPAVTDAGQLIVDVGVAPVQPAEFVIFRIGRTQDELEISEQIGVYT